MSDLPLSLTGVTKRHGLKAVKWLRRHSILAFYRAEDKSINAFQTKHGKEWTYAILERAYRETA